MFDVPFSLIATHFLADFIAQSDWMALNKSKNDVALTLHALVYSLFFIPWGLSFWLVTFVAHWFTDYCTSRVTSKLWFLPMIERTPLDIWPNGMAGSSYYGAYTHLTYVKPTRHWFFVMIGFDQLLHYAQLGLTCKYF